MEQTALSPLYDHLHEGACFLDKNGAITYWNSSASQITGYTAEDVLGQRLCHNLLSCFDRSGNSLCDSCTASLVPMSTKSSERKTSIRRKDGTNFPVLMRSLLVGTGPSQFTIVLFTRNLLLKDLNDHIDELERLAYFDPLTGLNNRRAIEAEIERRLAERRRSEIHFGVLFMDLDDFKKVNDTFGHAAGDEVLKHVAGIMKECVRDTDVIGRIGGEEFVILAKDVDERGLVAIAHKLQDRVKNMLLQSKNIELTITLSIGGTLAHDGDSVKSLLHRADQQMYQSKTTGKNKTTFK